MSLWLNSLMIFIKIILFKKVHNFNPFSFHCADSGVFFSSIGFPLGPAIFGGQLNWSMLRNVVPQNATPLFPFPQLSSSLTFTLDKWLSCLRLAFQCFVRFARRAFPTPTPSPAPVFHFDSRCNLHGQTGWKNSRGGGWVVFGGRRLAKRGGQMAEHNSIISCRHV